MKKTTMKIMMAALAIVCATACAETLTEEAALVATCMPTQELYFQNRRLVDVEDLAITGYQKFGYVNDTREYRWTTGPLGAGSFGQSGLYLYANDGSALTVEFHGRTHGSNGGIGNGFVLELTQEGSDIHGQLTWTGGFTGADAVFTNSWYGLPISGLYAYNSTNATYSSAGTNLKLYFTDASSVPRTVTFLDKNNDLIDTYVVPIGDYAAVAPTPPAFNGYVFYAWDSDFSRVKTNMTVTALYHELFTVTFVDADGTTVIDTQLVEETTAATAPDMTGRTYNGEPFIGWDVDFSNILGNLTVTAVYGLVPDYVQGAISSGLLPSDALIWSGGGTGVWDNVSENWRDISGVKRVWRAGAPAAISIPAAISVSGAQDVGKIIALNDAATVTFSGDPINFTGSATARFATNSTIRFNNDIGGADGFVQIADAGVAALTEFAGDYSSEGCFAVSNGTIKIVGAGTLFGGNMTAVGGSVTSPIYIGKDCRIEFDSTSAQTFATLINATNAGSGWPTMKTFPTTGRFVVGPNARDVTFTCTAEGMHRFYNAIDVYGTVSVTSGTYHLIHGNDYGIFIHDGGVLNLDKGYGSYGHRSARHTCCAGGVVNFNAVESMGAADHTLALDGGEARLNADYTANLAKDNAHNNIIMKNGAKMTGTMMTMGWNRTAGNTLAVDGTNACSIALGKIRFGQNAITAAADKKMLETFDIADVTGDASADLTVSSELYVNSGAVWTPATAPWLGFIKKGAGTMLLTGVSTNFGGSVTLNAGTLAFGSAARLTGPALVVTGDATLDVAQSGRIAFADSSDMVWTEGKTLTVSGELGAKTLRFGTDANGLTADQLAQIQKPDSTALAWLSSEGYLRIGKASTMLLLK
ncbi:MAG: hypothetical protein ACOX9C_02535 [Kiritimatiellia bacterium]|jgi:autotransporter-associated beta strand protein